MNPLLHIQSVKKAFGATRALEGVSLKLPSGMVLAIIGENGAGKSTLMKILSGVLSPDDGRILLEGKPYSPQNPHQARQAGVAMVYQELSLAPDLTVAENINLGSEPHRLGFLQKTELETRAHRALSQIGHPDIPLHAPVRSLSLAHQQVVEIARALSWNPQVLVLDEPTSSLSLKEAQNLYSVIHRLKSSGLGILYISHFLEECQELADTFLVLRDGRDVGGGDIKSTPLPSIISMMVGRDVAEVYPRHPSAAGPTALEIRGLAGLTKPRSVSLSLARGEILGLAGLVGAGRTETLRAIFGLDPVAAGDLRLSPRSSPDSGASPGQRIRQGFGMLSENRKEEGLMLNRSIRENMTLSRLGPLTRAGCIRSGNEKKSVTGLMQLLRIRARDSEQSVGELSGGNQQKVALARLLHQEAAVLLLDEPTRGIDVGSKVEIYRLLGELSARGVAIIFVSSYIPELLGVCDSIAVMNRGVLSEKRPVREWTEEDIMHFCVQPPDSFHTPNP
ncbi:MAG: sugar ABC transporter ATP-binding protein [Verrucomicrobiae bacterium]|nr:sugar ABC transporter ATP-binding protein [Verrucomicrobiae bacterium]